MTNYIDSSKAKHITIAALTAIVFWFLFSLKMPTIINSESISYFFIFIHENIRIPLTLLIITSGVVFESYKNTKSTLGYILGFILGSILGFILGYILGSILENILGGILGVILGYILGYILGFILGGILGNKK